MMVVRMCRPQRRPLPIHMAVSLLACVFAACGGSDESSRAGSADQRISDRELQVMLQSANDFTREIIEDGVVTPEEYERAVFRTMQCMDDAGVEHTEPVFKEFRFESRWEYSIVGGIGSAADNAYIECYDEFEASVKNVWNEQQRISEEESQMVAEEHLECVREAGIDVASTAELSAIIKTGNLSNEHRSAHMRCLTLVYEGWDINDLE